MDDSKINTAVSLLSQEITPLKECCEQVILQEVTGTHLENAFRFLNKDQKNAVTKLLPLTLSLDIVVPVVYEETYWSRKCIATNWNYVHYWINNCSWRDTFISHFVEDSVDNFLSKKTSFGELVNDIVVLEKHLKRLRINGYKANLAQDDKGNTFDSVDISFEDFVSKLLKFFLNVEEVYLNIAPAKYAVWDESVEHQNFMENIFLLKRLVKLTIIGYSLTETQMAIIAGGIAESLVRFLNLSCNLLTDDCCDSIGELLKSSCLEKLILSNNSFGNSGIQKVITCLSDNRTLISFDISKNNIDDEGGVAIANSLKTNKTLQKLDISFNKLEHKAGVAFNDVLVQNNTLLYLNISGNRLGIEVGNMFSESLTKNKSLQYFGVEFCGFSESEEDMIFSKIQKNRNGNDNGIFL